MSILFTVSHRFTLNLHNKNTGKKKLIQSTHEKIENFLSKIFRNNKWAKGPVFTQKVKKNRVKIRILNGCGVTTHCPYYIFF